jgi:RNase P subunit RPR2
MSKPTQRIRAQRLMELMRLIDAETEEMNRQRRYVAELKRQALKLVRGK